MLPYSFFEGAMSANEAIKTVSIEEYRVNCPECNDTNGHLYFNLRKMVYICHKCGAKGRIIKSLYNIPKLDSYEEVVNSFYTKGEIDIPLNPIHTTEQKVEPKRTVPIFDLIPVGYDRAGTAKETIAYNYLINRGLTDYQIKRYSIGLGRYEFEDYIVFPITTIPDIGTMKYWVARYIGKDKAKTHKYINAPWSKEDVLYIADKNVEATWFDGVIVEGVFDALAIERVSFKSIALLGKSANARQIERLIDEATKGYVIFLDSDAFSKAVELQLQLRTMANISNKSNLNFRVMQVPRMDPAACALEDIEKLREELDEENTIFKHYAGSKSKM
jgi:DNA primase